MAKTLQMIFLNTTGKQVSINIPELKESVTPLEVKTLMELIVTRNIFTSSGGDLKAIMEASLVSRDVEPITVK